MRQDSYEVVGWGGAAMIVAAYFVLSLGGISADSITYHVLNAVGASRACCMPRGLDVIVQR